MQSLKAKEKAPSYKKNDMAKLTNLTNFKRNLVKLVKLVM